MRIRPDRSAWIGPPADRLLLVLPVLLLTFVLERTGCLVATAALNLANVYLVRGLPAARGYPAEAILGPGDALRKAEFLLRVALDYEPTGQRALLAYGRWQALDGGLPRALDLFREAVEQRPTDRVAWFLKANAEWELGRINEAVADWRRAGTARIPLELAAQAEESQNWARAERFYLLALEVSPESASAHFLYGHLLWRQLGATEEAIALLRRATSLAPGSAPFWAELALALETAGQIQEATDAAANSVRATPAEPSVRALWMRVLWKSGRADEAMRVFEESLRVCAPSSWVGDMHGVAGLILEQEGHTSAACIEWQAALRLHPGQRDAVEGILRRRCP